jgi:hypothetical protein
VSSVASSDLSLSNTDVEGLLNKIKKLEQEAKEKDKKIKWLEQEGQKKDKIIGLLKLDDRCQECIPTKKNDLNPSSYVHLGWAESDEDLGRKMELVTGYNLSTGDLHLRKIYHKINPEKSKCDIHSSELLIGSKCTVLYKDNTVQCGIHKIIIVAIIEKGVIQGEQLEWLKSKIWNEMIPRINFTTDGHDGVSEFSRKKATKNLKKKLNNQTLCKKIMQNLKKDFKKETLKKEKLFDKMKKMIKKESESKIHCQCNGPPSARTGGFATWGCTLKKVGSEVCKFNIPAVNGRKKFHLQKTKLNDPIVEEVVTIVADTLTERVLCLAPLAAKLMANEATEVSSCRLGTKNKFFAAMSLNANFRIHSHIDKKDFPNGITCLLNVHRTNAEAGQQHVLVDYSLEETESPGIAFDIGSGSILLECASREWHASTKPVNPNLKNPSRVALVFFSHRGLNKPDHGSNTLPKNSHSKKQLIHRT